MDMSIVSKKENALLKRTEVRFAASHANEPTPKRDAVREKLAGLLSVKKEAIVVDAMESDFGRATTTGYARVYANADEAKKQERWYLLKRNGFDVGEKRAKAAAAPAASAKKGGR
ncbi:MAG TPA: 30S ribosomal protein S24e [Candidatus Thermoplasmatota archaeon]|nr:30S ribosomal protein S24e [Candidatus Thermoplasmatota archaeon]